MAMRHGLPRRARVPGVAYLTMPSTDGVSGRGGPTAGRDAPLALPLSAPPGTPPLPFWKGDMVGSCGAEALDVTLPLCAMPIARGVPRRWRLSPVGGGSESKSSAFIVRH